jgi:hypothetical protein
VSKKKKSKEEETAQLVVMKDDALDLARSEGFCLAQSASKKGVANC